MMYLVAFSALLFILTALFGSNVVAQGPSGLPFPGGVAGDATTAGGRGGPDGDGKFHIASKGIRASFVPYGAAISNLFVKDRRGTERDIVLGWDNASYYTLDKQHPHYGSVPGRYANRIKNSTFEIDGRAYHVLPNENNGADTLHGGPHGWDWRNWTVVAHTADSITFSLTDPDGSQGFPGEVISYVTYSKFFKRDPELALTSDACSADTTRVAHSHVCSLPDQELSNHALLPRKSDNSERHGRDSRLTL